MTDRWLPEDAPYAQWLTKDDGTVIAHVARDDSGKWFAFYPMYTHLITKDTREQAQQEIQRVIEIKRSQRQLYLSDIVNESADDGQSSAPKK